jgi:hypothetical protein
MHTDRQVSGFRNGEILLHRLLGYSRYFGKDSAGTKEVVDM